MWIKMDKESSAGHQSGANEQPTEEIERNGTISVSCKPPTAYKTLNPHRIWPSEENLGSLELLLSSLFSPAFDIRCMDSISTCNGLFHLNIPEIPRFLAIPRSDSSWSTNWKVLVLNGHQLRALVDDEPSTLFVSI